MILFEKLQKFKNYKIHMTKGDYKLQMIRAEDFILFKMCTNLFGKSLKLLTF